MEKLFDQPLEGEHSKNIATYRNTDGVELRKLSDGKKVTLKKSKCPLHLPELLIRLNMQVNIMF